MADKLKMKSKITEYFGKSPVRFEPVKESRAIKNESVNDKNDKSEDIVNAVKEVLEKEQMECAEAISNDIEDDEQHGDSANDDESSEMHFPCSNCDFITSDENEIMAHMEECGELEDINTESFNSEDIMQHDGDLSLTANNGNATESQFPCSNCDYLTDDLEEIESHMATCTEQDDSKTTAIDMDGSKENVPDTGNNESLPESQFPCSNCDFLTDDLSDIASHMALCTGQNDSNTTSIDMIGSKENVIDTNSGDVKVVLHYTCSNCDFIGFSEDEVLVHMKTCTDDYDLKTPPYYTVYRHDSIKKTYKFMYSSQDQETNKKVLANKVIQRKRVDESSSKQKLKRMRILYSKTTKEKEEAKRNRIQTAKGTVYTQVMKKKNRDMKKEFVCDICEFKTDNKNYIEQHVTLVHSDEKPIQCTECDYRCKRQGDLKSHMLVHQEKVRNFICKICGWSTYRSSKLKLHMRKHTGETPYDCPLCDYSSYKSDGLSSHMKIHSVERPFKCDVCGSAFKQAHNLNAHKNIHTGNQPKNYICKLCDYACGTPHTLKNHMLTHSNERPFQCAKCDYTCKLKSNLRLHELKHTKVKPYVCIECGFATKLPQTLKRHSKIHTREYSGSEGYKGLKGSPLDPMKLRGREEEKEVDESGDNEMIYIKSEF